MYAGNREQQMTPEEKQLLEQVNTKLDTLLACFGLAGKNRTTPRELEEWADGVVLQYQKRKQLKSLPESG